ncbi:MAG: tRNA pseudouridine(55) synthase TruB [Thermoanaerobaculia bacterium]|nr:tRNA pseudouridine(55) synthase TruB [Thermoanaerobaculia bacterium]
MRNGILLVDKEVGLTSHDVVVQARKIFRQKKIGHCGTLDPDATGLLALTVGKATRLTRFFIKAPKVYRGIVRFGIATDTYDAAGEVVDEAPTDHITMERIEQAMKELEGTYLQTPPPYCAKKIDGVKYYELARQGKEVPLEPKEVTVYSFEPEGELEDDRIEFSVSCASGTYARSLAFDLGRKVGSVAHLHSLRRLEIGHFSVEQSATLAEIREAVEAGEDPPGWIPFDEVPLPFGEAITDPQQEKRLVHGQTALLRNLEGDEGDWIKLVNQRREFIAVGTVVERIGTGGSGVVQPRIVFR